ncbi:hypothetical protein [Hyphomicrobium sp. 2TAF46]|uniref:hypothetical protein n=1 Tax=Hyphomicrobium sp. 2TAF46 TaxID=3233019 RepID=UPI003F8DDC1E
MEAELGTDSPELLRLRLEVWKESIRVTQSFTDISHKTRQMGMTAGVGGLALAVTLLTQFPEAKLSVPYRGYDYATHLAGLIMILAGIAIAMTKFLDVHLHHRMLRGSVAFTQNIERTKAFKELMGVERGLAESITFHSRSKRAISDSDAVSPAKKTSAEYKLRRFYNCTIGAIVAMGIATIFTTYSVTRHDTVRINQTIEMPTR